MAATEYLVLDISGLHGSPDERRSWVCGVLNEHGHHDWTLSAMTDQWLVLSRPCKYPHPHPEA
jgi:hypothetical protein